MDLFYGRLSLDLYTICWSSKSGGSIWAVFAAMGKSQHQNQMAPKTISPACQTHSAYWRPLTNQSLAAFLHSATFILTNFLYTSCEPLVQAVLSQNALSTELKFHIITNNKALIDLHCPIESHKLTTLVKTLNCYHSVHKNEVNSSIFSNVIKQSMGFLKFGF